MSLEQRISELTEAVAALTKMLQSQQAGATPEKPAVKPKAEKPAPESESAKEPEGNADASTEAADGPSTAEADDARDTKELSYEADVKPLFLKLVAERGRDVAVELIAEFNPKAKKLNEALDGQDDFAAAIKRIEELLAGNGDD